MAGNGDCGRELAFANTRTDEGGAVAGNWPLPIQGQMKVGLPPSSVLVFAKANSLATPNQYCLPFFRMSTSSPPFH